KAVPDPLLREQHERLGSRDPQAPARDHHGHGARLPHQHVHQTRRFRVHRVARFRARLPDARAGHAGRLPAAPVHHRDGVRDARAAVRSEPLSLEGPQGQGSCGRAPGTLFSAGASARDGVKEGAAMPIGVLALVGLAPERVAALTAAGYAVREARKYAHRRDAVREAGETVRAVLTNGRGGLSGDEMALLPHLEIVCTVSAGYEAVDLDTARRRGIAVAHCPDTNASAVADSAMMLLMAATRHVRQADRHVHAGAWQDQWRV